MSRQNLQYLLAPDAGVARRLRRILAEQSARSGMVVGTWSELMEWACRAYLVPETTDDNDSGFRNALEELEDAFWTESLSVAPVETSEAVKSALIKIVSASDPTSDMGIAGLEGLSERPRRHLDDLFRLIPHATNPVPYDQGRCAFQERFLKSGYSTILGASFS